MDINDYDDDNLSMVAGNCRYLSYNQSGKPAGASSAVSCRECRSWTGSGCKRHQFEDIASEMQLD